MEVIIEKEEVIMAVSKGCITLFKLEVAVVIIKEEESPPLFFQGHTELLTSISGVSGAIKVKSFQINAHTNRIPTPQVQIEPNSFISFRKNIYKHQLYLTTLFSHLNLHQQLRHNCQR